MTDILSSSFVNTVFHFGKYSFHNIYTTTDFLINGSNSHISERLEKLDIKDKIKIIDAFIGEVTINESLKYKKSINLALESIQSVITKINDELLEIRKECDLHETRYFHYWRVPNCEYLFTNLINHIEILDKRMIILKDIIQICNQS